MTRKKQDKEHRNLIERLIIHYGRPVGIFDDNPLTIGRARKWVKLLDKINDSQPNYSPVLYKLNSIAKRYSCSAEEWAASLLKTSERFDPKTRIAYRKNNAELLDKCFKLYDVIHKHPVKLSTRLYQSFCKEDANLPSLVKGYCGPESFSLKFVAYIPKKRPDRVYCEWADYGATTGSSRDEERIIKSPDKYDKKDSFIETKEGLLKFNTIPYFFKKFLHKCTNEELKEIRKKTRQRYDVNLPMKELKAYAKRMKLDFERGAIHSVGDEQIDTNYSADLNRRSKLWHEVKEYNIFGKDWPGKKVIE